MPDILIKPYDAAYMQIKAVPHVAMEMSEYFTFEVPNAKFSYKFKMGWDGKIKLFNPLSGMLYAGLTEHVKLFASDRGYSVESLIPAPPVFSEDKLTKFIDFIDPKYEVRDYQFSAFAKGINDQRGIFISPTASGKSFIIYLMARLLNELQKPVLIIVPTTALVTQMKADFLDYNRDRSLPIHTISDGSEKKVAPITIATWQSIYKLQKPFFANFGGIIGDEVHTFKATSLKSIMEKATQTYYRVGLTGTLDGSETNRLTLEGLFGPVNQVTTYDRLLEDGHIVKPIIKVVLFHYSKQTKSAMRKAKKDDGQKGYAIETEYIVRHDRRNAAIASLVKSLKGNVLVLFNRVDKHGIPLHNMFQAEMPNRSHHLIHGKVDTDDREEIRQILEMETNAVAACSYQTFGTGINVKNLHHLVYAGPPGKSIVRVLQSIGRGLRVHDTKDKFTIWDLADDLPSSIKHLESRINIYNSVGFDFTIHERNLE